MKKTHYAAKFPDGRIEIYDNWPDCSRHVTGVKGVLYKGFTTESSMKNWINNQSINHGDTSNAKVKIYVDGSFFKNCKRAGWAFAVVENDELIHEKHGVTEWDAPSRNIDGEVVAAANAILWAVEHDYKNAVIVHDYLGISAWLTGDWSTIKEIGKWYKRQVKKYAKFFVFDKIKGHSRNKWNDFVDEKAKDGIREYRKQLFA